MEKTKTIIFALAFICTFNFLFSQENKFIKTYELNYFLKKGTKFTLTNRSYFVEYKKIADDVKKFQQPNCKKKHYNGQIRNNGYSVVIIWKLCNILIT